MAALGVQMMTVKQKVAQDGLARVLERIAGMGFIALEMSQIPMSEDHVTLLEQARTDLGLEVGAISVILKHTPQPFADAIDTDYAKILSDARRLGTRYARVGMMPIEAMSTYAAVESWSAEIEAAAQQLAGDGITLCYHNHHVDLARYNGERIFDIVRRLAPSVHFEVDLHWVQRGGANPSSVLREYAGVVDLIHLKDYAVATIDPEVLAQRSAMTPSEWQAMFSSLVRFAPVGDGNIDWTTVIPAALESGAQYLFVEQDDLYGADPYDCLQRSMDYVTSIGYGRL